MGDDIIGTMQDAKELVRERLAIEEVIGEYVQLQRAGRNLKGLSPFTDERTPSFMVSPDKQIWHDFSSGKGGDVFSFVMLVEGLDFREALERLARKAGVDLAMFSRGNGQIAKRRERARQALNLATRFYQQMLVKTPAALAYVSQRRHLHRQVVEDFRIGYAPDSGQVLVDALQARGFSRRELHDAGLINRFGGDLFRGRMMVLLSDPTGQPVGFTGRIVADDPKAPKYLNTPQTVLFDKSRHIFGLYQAREAIRQANEVVIVEGNLDVVSSHQAGVTQVVATAGTAMTIQHLKTLSRLTERVKLAFDADKAGIAATERAISLAQTVGVELDVVTLPDGTKDPDELIQRDDALWRQAVQQARPAVEWVIDQYNRRYDLQTAEGRRHFSTAALAVIGHLRDPVEQEYYMAQLSQQTGASMAALQAKLAGAPVQPVTQKQPKVAKSKPVPPSDDTEDALLGVAVSQPALRRWLVALAPEMMQTEQAQELLSILQQDTQFDPDHLPARLQKYEQYVKIVQLKYDNRYSYWEPASLEREMGRLVKKLITKHRNAQKQHLVQQLRDAEAMHDESRADALRQQLNVLIKEHI